MPSRKCSYKPCGIRVPKEQAIVRGVQAWCSEDHQVAWAIEAGRKLRERQHREKVRQHRADSLPHQIDLTQSVFNKLIRLLDRGKLCPTCGNPLIDGMYDAGHVRTVASCPQLRFDARNCFGQCRSCNGSGTIRRRVRKTQEVVSELYKAWVLSTYGQRYVDWLYGPHASPQWQCADLVEMRKEFSAEVRRLERGEQPSRDWRKLPD